MAGLDAGSFPFIMVDKILGCVPGERAIGLRNVTANDPLLASGGGREGPADASPQAPMSMRRSLLVEAFSQLASHVLSPAPIDTASEGASGQDGCEALRPVEISRIESMRFVRSPVPGDQLVLTVVLEEAVEIAGGGDGLRASCRAEAGGELVAEGTLEFAAPAGTFDKLSAGVLSRSKGAGARPADGG